MTVRIGEAGQSGDRRSTHEHFAQELTATGERFAVRSPFTRHRLVWRFSPQTVAQKPKA